MLDSKQVLQNFALFMLGQSEVRGESTPEFYDFMADVSTVFGTYMYSNKDIAWAYEYALGWQEAAAS